MPTEKPRFTITMDESLFQKIENFRFDGHYKNQTKAVTVLIERGLDALAAEDSEVAKAIKSAPLYSSGALKLAADYDGLDGYGQQMLRLVAVAEKARCAEQAKTTTTKLRIAARDGSRMEVEVDDDLTLPEEDSQLP